MDIFEAISNFDFETLAKIVKQNRDSINRVNEDNLTPHHVAVFKGSLEVVNFLIQNGADVNKGDEENTTPLHVSCATVNSEICELLIQNGADVNALTTSNYTPMHLATEISDLYLEDQLVIVKLLIKNGAKLFPGNPHNTGLKGFVEFAKDEDVESWLIQLK